MTSHDLFNRLGPAITPLTCGTFHSELLLEPIPFVLVGPIGLEVDRRISHALDKVGLSATEDGCILAVLDKFVEMLMKHK